LTDGVEKGLHETPSATVTNTLIRRNKWFLWYAKTGIRKTDGPDLASGAHHRSTPLSTASTPYGLASRALIAIPRTSLITGVDPHGKRMNQ
jgi:hypothetical protein